MSSNLAQDTTQQGGQRSFQLRIHPADHRRGLPPGIFRSPYNRTPFKGSDGRVMAWGLFPDNYFDEPEAMMTIMYRQTLSQQLYPNGDWPEYQFVDVLMEEKKKELESLDIGENARSDYILKVALSFHERPQDEVWRRVKVSGGLSLTVFADKVLTPLMGWTRNYHTHLFTDYRDGAIFGPKNSTSTDFFGMILRGYRYVEESKWKIAHLLRKDGDEMGWTYDLGDNWEHVIAVEAIGSVSDSDGRIVILGGGGACPAEDSRDWPEVLDDLASPRAAKRRAALEKIYSSSNYIEKPKPSPLTFDPHHFDTDEATARVKDALSLPGSYQLGMKKLMMPLIPEGLTMADFDPKMKKEFRMKTPLGNGAYMEESTTGKRDSPSANACSNCGTPHGLALDTGCRAVYYCGRTCQIEHWNARHKRDCKRLQKTGMDTRPGAN